MFFIYYGLYIMDAPWIYIWATHPKRLSRREIENMKKNMKKVPIIAAKSDIYHQKEEQEAEKLLSQLHESTK